jgi:hypothetical protein
MEGGIWPVLDVIDPAMFDWIIMDIINMPLEIDFIPDEMFPKTPLPDGGLSIFGLRSRR